MLLVNQVQCGDCLSVLKSAPDNCVDLVFTDPPYNVGKDYGVSKDNMERGDYLRWMGTVIEECRRVSRGGIAFYVGGLLTRDYVNLIPDAHLIVVHKRAVGVMCGGFFLQYHSLLTTATPSTRCKDLWDDVRLPGEGYFFRERRYPHPGLTSLALTKKVLGYFLPPGGIVLDPFMGTGTTAVAAAEMGSKWCGCELNPDYCEIWRKRIEEAANGGGE